MDKFVPQVRNATIGGNATQYASTMLSQSLMGPVFRELLSTNDVNVDVSERAKAFYSKTRGVASSSEILSGYYYYETKKGLAISRLLIDVGYDKGYSDPLAFAIGYDAARNSEGEPPNLPELRDQYNKAAQRLFEEGGVAVFGVLGENPVKKTGQYTGGLDAPSVVVGQLVNWWFLRPTHEEALGLFQTVKGYIDGHSDETAKNNDMLILKRAAWDMIQAKKEAELWGKDDAIEIFNAWNGSVPVAAKALETLKAVNETMELGRRTRATLRTVLDRTDDDLTKSSIKKFYGEAIDSKTHAEAIKSAAELLIGLLRVDENYTLETKEVERLDGELRVFKGKIRAFEDTMAPLRARIEELVKEREKLVEERKPLVEEKMPFFSGQKPRLGHDAAALIFQHSHPEILTQVFARETVDHFDSIASSLYTNEENQDEGPLVVSSSATGEITQWLL